MVYCAVFPTNNPIPATTFLPFLKYKKNSPEHHHETGKIVPFKIFFQIHDRKHTKNRQCNHFLNGVELRGCEKLGTDAICRNLKAIFKERDQPT